MRAPPTVRLGHTLSIDNRGSEIETYSLVHEKANKMYSPANAHAVFSIQTVRPCTGLLFVIAENSPVAWFCSCPIFCQLRFFGNVIHLRPKTFAAKKNKENGGQNTCSNFRVYLSKATWTFGLLCAKMSKIRYFLQITWL